MEIRHLSLGLCNLDAFGVWSLSLRVGAGLQGFVKVVDGLAGGLDLLQYYIRKGGRE